jgi:cytochrome c5
MKKTFAFAAVATLLAVSGLAQAEGRDGKAVYDTKCFVCHVAGVAGAPKFGDKAAWEPRAAKGMDEMLKISKTGTAKGMPPMGTCMDCSDDEMKAAIEYMLEAAK